MDEKEKNKGKAASNTLFGISLGYIALAILAIPLACGAVIGLFVGYHTIRLHQCFDENEPFEWNGLLDFPASETQIPMTEANLSEISILPYYPDDTIFPSFRPAGTALYYTDNVYSPAISHPAHDYFLSSNALYLDIYYNPRLIICQPDGWASHVLSSGVRHYRFSPDGSLFAAILYQEIEIYDANTIELFRTLEFPELSSVGYFAFHPTEALIAILGSESDMVSLYFWNYETQEELSRFVISEENSVGWFDSLAFNEEGTLLIASKRYGRDISSRIWGIPPE